MPANLSVKSSANAEQGTAHASRFVDKQWLRQQLAQMDAAMGFVLDPLATAQAARALMLADGIRPEDNEASQEMSHLRYKEDFRDNP